MRQPWVARRTRQAGRWAFILAAALTAGCSAARVDIQPMPTVKQYEPLEGRLRVRQVAITADDARLAGEVENLRALLAERGIAVRPRGTPVRLEWGDVELPKSDSRYRAEHERQAYRLRIDRHGVVVRAPSSAGVFYGLQTLAQLVADDRSLPCVEILDWPDLAVRSIMVDAARANENMGYYQRVLEFCARHKINRLHLHLTDDENASLYHEDYPALLHPHAWRAEQLAELVALASRRHVELVAEIESLGHARLFVRQPDGAEYLHQTTDTKPKKSWAGTALPGYTNVLCPGSERTYEYLDRMYTRVAEIFPALEIHIGCDEVDMTECARCRAKFGAITHGDWFLRHLLRCRELVARHGRSVGIWGDMLLHHREIIDDVPTSGTLIYDWQYRPDMTEESAVFFQQQGFEVLGCPALVCHPHMILPSDYNYRNIRRFAEVARTHDLLGLNTTVWTPTRYASDVLWPGLAFAAGQAWGGSTWCDEAFYAAFTADFFGSPAGAQFGAAWSQLAAIRWWLDDFKLSCWIDAEGLAAAAEAAGGAKGAKAQQHRERLGEILRTLEGMDASVRRNRRAWEAILQSVRLLDYTLEHLLVSPQVVSREAEGTALLRELDARCVQALGWIEADWDYNRFADDPYKQDLNATGQHLLDRFRRMHQFHRELLGEDAPSGR